MKGWHRGTEPEKGGTGTASIKRECEARAMPERGWQSWQTGRVLLHFRAHSFAAQDLDELARRLDSAVTTVGEVLGREADRMPPVTVYVADEPPNGASEPCPADGTDAAPAGLIIRTVHSPEMPDLLPEIELARALLTELLGQPGPAARFWDEGLSGHVAARNSPTAYHAEAGARCRRLLMDGLLPPLGELVPEADTRVSAVVGTAATAFAGYLIGRFGPRRLGQLLEAARTGREGAFEQVFSCPLAVVERDWRRGLESAGRDSEPSMWATVRRLLPLARPHWRAGLVILGCTLVNIGFSLALPLAFRFLVDHILMRAPLRDPTLFVGPRGHVIGAGQEQLETLLELVAGLGLLYLLNAGAKLRANTMLIRVGESFALDLRQRLMAGLGRLPAAYFARTPTADINQRVVQDTATIQVALTGALIPMVGGALSILLYAAILISIEARLAAIALLPLPFLLLIYRLRRRKRRAAARERSKRIADLSGRVNELAGAQILVKLYAAAPYLLRRLGQRMEAHRQLNIAYEQDSTLLSQIGTLIMNLSQVAVLLIGGYLVVTSDGRALAAGGLVAFYVLLNQLFTPLAQLTAAAQIIVGASASVERVSELLNEPTEQDAPDGVELAPLRDALAFGEVVFAYPGGRPVLEGVSLLIPAGSTVGLVGPTGAGKSSLAQLLTRLYRPKRGTITWDGVDIQSARLDSLRGRVVLVPQDSLLLNTTLYENIRFGLENVADRDVEHAARLAQAHDFIAQLPGGYDTIVGEQGAGLSGGQRQRIALARALLRDPSILILDEATSALDATTQRAVQGGLREHAAGRVIVKIAHRLETVADADIIFVFDDGRLVEQGKHAELLAGGGLYKRLFEDQMGTFYAAGRPDPRQAARWLARREPFSELPYAALEQLAAVLEPREHGAGRVIYERGSSADETYVLGHGRVEVVTTDEFGRQRVVNTFGTGATFGSVGFLRGGPRPATVRAVTDVLLFVLQRPAYEAVLERLNRPTVRPRPAPAPADPAAA